MRDKIVCPNCHKQNDIHKFCIYCGHELLDDDAISLMMDNLEPYCLNCGRAVRKGQKICECGYELEDVNCPDCNTRNSYTNRFCINCGKRLWTSNVFNYNYPERLFEEHLFNTRLPYDLHNTSLFNRPQNGIGKKNSLILPNTLDGLKSKEVKTNKNFPEIYSRWKIVSPNYCINCLNIVKPEEYTCRKCRSIYSADRKRIESIQSKNSYVKPKFNSVELKWTPKYNPNYLGSLAPAVGESQFEYRERLKWELAENNFLKKCIMNAIDSKKLEIEYKRREAERKRREEELEKQREEYIRQHGGGYCSYNCSHCYEEYFDECGGVVGDLDSEGYTEYYCWLGHSIYFGAYCKDYK